MFIQKKRIGKSIHECLSQFDIGEGDMRDDLELLHGVRMEERWKEERREAEELDGLPSSRLALLSWM